jgi:hypothetical protein
VEENSPVHPADESDGDRQSDDPHGAKPSVEPGTPLEAVSIAVDAGTFTTESEVEPNPAGRDVTEAAVPSAR